MNESSSYQVTDELSTNPVSDQFELNKEASTEAVGDVPYGREQQNDIHLSTNDSDNVTQGSVMVENVAEISDRTFDQDTSEVSTNLETMEKTVPEYEKENYSHNESVSKELYPPSFNKESDDIQCDKGSYKDIKQVEYEGEIEYNEQCDELEGVIHFETPEITDITDEQPTAGKSTDVTSEQNFPSQDSLISLHNENESQVTEKHLTNELEITSNQQSKDNISISNPDSLEYQDNTNDDSETAEGIDPYIEDSEKINRMSSEKCLAEPTDDLNKEVGIDKKNVILHDDITNVSCRKTDEMTQMKMEEPLSHTELLITDKTDENKINTEEIHDELRIPSDLKSASLRSLDISIKEDKSDTLGDNFITEEEKLSFNNHLMNSTSCEIEENLSRSSLFESKETIESINETTNDLIEKISTNNFSPFINDVQNIQEVQLHDHLGHKVEDDLSYLQEPITESSNNNKDVLSSQYDLISHKITAEIILNNNGPVSFATEHIVNEEVHTAEYLQDNNPELLNLSGPIQDVNELHKAALSTGIQTKNEVIDVDYQLFNESVKNNIEENISSQILHNEVYESVSSNDFSVKRRIQKQTTDIDEVSLNSEGEQRTEFEQRYAELIAKYLPVERHNTLNDQSRRTKTLDRYNKSKFNENRYSCIDSVREVKKRAVTLERNEFRRKRRLQPKPSVNDDYLYPDSVTPSKVDQSISVRSLEEGMPEGTYDVPYIDDDAFLPRKLRENKNEEDGSDDGSSLSLEGEYWSWNPNRFSRLEANHIADTNECAPTPVCLWRDETICLPDCGELDHPTNCEEL
ncbi:unnamed protein product [Heterobilharzia americana]|nr:unnamed protein product [Heterobilharzia americana]